MSQKVSEHGWDSLAETSATVRRTLASFQASFERMGCSPSKGPFAGNTALVSILDVNVMACHLGVAASSWYGYGDGGVLLSTVLWH